MSGGCQGQQQQALSEAVQGHHQHLENFGLLSVAPELILAEGMASEPKGYCGSV
jgi:hypothetical protein